MSYVTYESIFKKFERNFTGSYTVSFESGTFTIGLFPKPLKRKMKNHNEFDKVARYNRCMVIYHAHVERKCRGQGVYHRFNEILEEYARNNGIMIIHYDTVDDNLIERHKRRGYQSFILPGRYKLPYQEKMIFWKQY